MNALDLTARRCKPCEGGVPPLDQPAIDHLLQNLSGWEQLDKELVKTFLFKNFYETMAFVNATAWVAHRENHHPELEISFRQCRVHYSTHAIGGLSENDFICAAKIDGLYASPSA
ncbi:MAG: putative pterin-4-alpha-carbinolamine dehydratase [Betaproteobacteria bacterium ADurb.Bin341]|nr:MAG: putative pterin-4-alpha-carbinolamine dehydratase [Betaproteobacteria bacterium ADurb.Bin341]